MSGIRSIDDKLDLGAGYMVAKCNKSIEASRQVLTEYNKSLSQTDALQNAVADAETVLADLSDHMLTSVAAKFGKNSSEYEMAGGVRKHDRKCPTRRAVSAAS
ncbi:MAG: hypothetical protein AAFQ63_14900 [Cyanobacteria bacterium J06621_11]